MTTRFRGISIKAVLAGIAVYALFTIAWRFSFRDVSWSTWATVLISEIQSLAPGLVAGWIAGQRALVHGLLVVIGCMAASIIYLLVFAHPASPVDPLSMSAFFLQTMQLLTTLVAAIAGVGVRRHGLAI